MPSLAVNVFRPHTLEQHAQALANFLPSGRLFTAKNVRDSVYRMLLRGLAHTEQDAESLLVTFSKELDISTTTAFLEPWERTVGIPDECFDTNTTLEIRRQQVLIKLAALGVQTEQDFIDLAAMYGVEITIASGIEHNAFTLTFPIVFFDTAKQARFTMLVFYEIDQAYTFPYTFPIIFSGREIPVIECLFRKLVPANVDLKFIQVDSVDPIDDSAFNNGFSDGFG
jgi:uncharacterized protein YmfQ (DUF2313 family)